MSQNNRFNVESFRLFLKENVNDKISARDKIKKLLDNGFSPVIYTQLISGKKTDVKMMMDVALIFELNMCDFFTDQRACCGQFSTCNKACTILTRHLRECLKVTKPS